MWGTTYVKCKLGGFLQDGPLLAINGVITSTNRYKWPCKWVTRVRTPINGVITLRLLQAHFVTLRHNHLWPYCMVRSTLQDRKSPKHDSHPNMILCQMRAKNHLLCTVVCVFAMPPSFYANNCFNTSKITFGKISHPLSQLGFSLNFCRFGLQGELKNSNYKELWKHQSLHTLTWSHLEKESIYQLSACWQHFEFVWGVKSFESHPSPTACISFSRYESRWKSESHTEV